MPVAYRSSAVRSTGATVATFRGDMPSGVASGDFLVGFVANDRGATMSAAPTGWTLATGPQKDANNDSTGWTYWKVAAAPEASNYDWILDTASLGGTIIAAYTSADITGSVHKQASSGDANTVASHIGPSVVPSVDGCMIVGFHGTDESATFTPYFDQYNQGDERVDAEVSGFVELNLVDFLQTTAGSINFTFVTADNDGHTMHIIALAPTGGAPPPAYVYVPSQRILVGVGL